MVNRAFRPAIENHPALDSIIEFPRSEIGRWLRAADWDSLQHWLDTLAPDPTTGTARFDLVVDLQGLFRSGFMTWWTRAPHRIGFADARELGWLGYNRRVRVPASAGHVDRYLHLLASIGVEPVPDLRLYPGESARNKIAADPALRGRYVLLAPTTRGAGRAWPADRYGELARQLLARSKVLGMDGVVVSGLETERSELTPILNRPAPGLIDRVGATDIPGLMAMIERAALVVCNDSAAMHLAVAFARPLVALLGPTRVETAGPYRRAADVICHRRPGENVRHRDVAPSRALMERITVPEVMDACIARLTPQASVSFHDDPHAAG